MNFVFLSPNFPKTYYNFTQCLRNNGVTTLGIGDEPYDQLSQECRDSLVEYYKVNSLENYDEVYRAFAFFAFKYQIGFNHSYFTTNFRTCQVRLPN